MNSKKELLKKITSKVIEDIIDADFYEWPPICMGIYFQPSKPKVYLDNSSTKEDTNNCM